MSLKQTTPTKVKIGGTRFYITPFPALTAANMTAELAATLAPVMGMLAPLITSASTDKGTVEGLLDINVNDFVAALSSCSALDGNKVESLVLKLLTRGNVVAELEDENGKTEPERLTEDIINELFCGSIEDMFILCFHVLKENFSCFFGKLASQSGRAKQDEDTETKTVRPIL